MRLFRSVSACLLAFGLTTAAHASTITYNLSGITFQTALPYALTGSITIDTSTDKITLASLWYNGNSFTTNTQENVFQGVGMDFITGSNGQVALYYATAGIGTGNVSICHGACGRPTSSRTCRSTVPTCSTTLRAERLLPRFPLARNLPA